MSYKINERGVFGTVEKYNQFTNEGVIRHNEMSKPDVKFYKSDVQDGLWSGCSGWSGWSKHGDSGWSGWSKRETTLIGRCVKFDITDDGKAKNVRMLFH